MSLATFPNQFHYKDAQLYVEDVPLSRVADEIGTRVFVYSKAAIQQAYTQLDEALSGLDVQIIYAMKANDNPHVLTTLRDCGAGVDVVSGGELTHALDNGFDANKTVFAGVGKTKDELALGLKSHILQFNVESIPELDALEAVASEMGVAAPVALRINPNVDAKTHAKITTGKAENKFGIEIEDAIALADRIKASPHLSMDALALHIGSQLTDLEPYRLSYQKLAEVATTIGDLKRLDIGGGVGIRYDNETTIAPTDFAKMVRETVGQLGLPMLTEPGRYMVGNAGLLLSRVIYVKHGSTRKFLIVDAGMNDLIRPSLYDAYHNIIPIKEPAAGVASEPTDVVGPICESGDTFAQQRPLPPIAADDLIAFESAGAYCAVMASTYNGRSLPQEVMIDGDQILKS